MAESATQQGNASGDAYESFCEPCTKTAESATQQSNASGDAYESFCEPCTRRGKFLVVQGYCEVCNEYLCDNCQAVHKNQKMTRHHFIVDKNQMPKGPGSNTNENLCVQVCNTHHPEIIRFFCKAHDEPGCQDCMTLNHTSCKKCVVQDVSDGFKATEEFKETQQILDKFHKELEIMKDILHGNLKNLDTAYDNIQHKVTTFRKQINDYLDQIQKDIKQEVVKMKRTEERELKNIIAENITIKTEVEDILHKIQNDSNVNSIFVITKQAKQRLATMESEINKLEQSRRQLKHKVCVLYHSTQTESPVSAQTTLGKLLRKTFIDTIYAVKYNTFNINSTASYEDNMTVSTENDSKKCWIFDCAMLNANRMVVTDRENHKIKVVDISKKAVISRFRSSSQPYGATAVSGDKAAVTLPLEGKILLLNTDSRCTKTGEIEVHTGCRGIACRDGKLAVSYVDPGRVDIIDMQGETLYTIPPKHSQARLQTPNNIAFGLDNDTVIVSDHIANKVVVLTFEGQTLHTYTHDAMKVPRGIALTAEGLLLVCSWGNGCIHVVAPDFKSSKVIIENDEKLKNPICISYCDIKQRLYICNLPMAGDMENTIHVYELSV